MEQDLINLDALIKANEKNGSFFHNTGNKIRLLPYVTNNRYLIQPDLHDFHGIVGLCMRLSKQVDLPKVYKDADDYQLMIKDNLLNQAVEKTEIDGNKDVFKKILEELFIDKDERINKFNLNSMLYANFSTNKPGTLLQIGRFIYDIFFKSEELQKILNEKKDENNPLFELIELSLPELEKMGDKPNDFTCILPNISELFQKDIKFLVSDKTLFLDSIEDITKYYYFYYVSQLALNYNRHFQTQETIPLYFSLEWEKISKSRKTYSQGWEILSTKFDNLFSHICFFEFVNYLDFGNYTISNYEELNQFAQNLKDDQIKEYSDAIQILMDYYEGKIEIKEGDWDDCKQNLAKNTIYNSLSNAFLQKMYSFYYMIEYQFIHDKGSRNSAYKKYANWIKTFCSTSYLKNRGRLGAILTLNQETLLLLTRICIGKNNKIRLKDYWIEMESRGVYFDQISKAEIIQLFEKINLIEKKSDSGDAQYVRSTI